MLIFASMAGQRNVVVDDIVDVIDMLDTCEAHVAAGHSVSLSYLSPTLARQ